MILGLETSNRILQVTEIRMYHAKAVAVWRGKMAAAQEKMGGVNTGIGLIGEPELVITGALVLGALEKAVSNANAKIGIKLLGEANTFLEEMHERSVFIPISDVKHIDRPQPEMWQATQGSIDFMMMAGDFMRVRIVSGKVVNVRWSAVSSSSLVN